MISITSAGAAAFIRPLAREIAPAERPDSKAQTHLTGQSAATANTPPGGTKPVARVLAASKTNSVNTQSTQEINTAQDDEELSEEQQRQVQKLKQTDAKVRAHESAHAAAGGNHASGPSFEYTTGPDGKRYATSGEVQIDTSAEKTPEATVRKMDIVIRAALAPADPSSQDLAVARQAQATRAQAQIEVSKKREAERNGNDGVTSNETKPSPLQSIALEAKAAYTQSQPRDDSAIASEIFSAIAQASIFA